MTGDEVNSICCQGRPSCHLLAGTMLIALTAAVYLPAIPGPFIWDDDIYITEDPRMETLAGLGKIWMDPFRQEHRHQFYPLTVTAFWLQHQLWGESPVGYRTVNVLLHAINAVLLWRVLRRLRLPGAWIAGAIFSVHPVHVVSVAWITELKNVLSTLFFLSAAMAMVRFFSPDGMRWSEKAGRMGGARWFWYVLGLSLFVCALLSKTATALLPIALLLVLWWKSDRLRWQEVVALLPMVIIGSVFVLATVWLESRYSPDQVNITGSTWMESWLIASRSIWFYAGKLIWPDELMMIYPRWQVAANVWWQYVYLLGVLIVIVLLWLFRWKIGKGPLAATAYFVIAVSPVSFVTVGFMTHSFVADHWQYWASMGLVVPAAAGSAILFNRCGKPIWLGCLAVIVALMALCGLTSQRCSLYRDQMTLWSNTLAKNPGSFAAHNNLGNALLLQSKVNQAIWHYRSALRLNPNYPDPNYNLGRVLYQQGEMNEAKVHLRQAIQAAAGYIPAHVLLGLVHQSQGKQKQAIAAFKQAIKLDPDSVQAHYNLGRIYHSQGQAGEAVSHYRQVLRLTPRNGVVYFELADVFGKQGQFDQAMEHLNQAIDHFRRALAKKPRSKMLRKNLDRVLETMRRYENEKPAKPDEDH